MEKRKSFCMVLSTEEKNRLHQLAEQTQRSEAGFIRWMLANHDQETQ